MRYFDGGSLQCSGRNFDSELTRLPRGLGIGVDRTTGQLKASVIQLIYPPTGSRTWTDGLTDEIFDLFNEITLGSVNRIAAAYDTIRVHIFTMLHS
ncbi:unnamed protein product [Rotaria socialis]|uniref:Uncharacterized protein n=1 Tax=Rotaria socialis TaxID=392032 RepID=A0A817XTT7_9BILA|nr:unnamed protein product [Rotaria socialis]CAF4717561.1 unnamed protein product [Rotaria socialis]